MLAAVFALALWQDAQTLADSVTERDSGASFRAISKLVDLADARHEEVERVAAKLPAFYREVLLSELNAKRELGVRFGRGIRMDLKGTGRTLWDYLEEIGRRPGMAVKIEEWNRKHGPHQGFDVDLKDVWAIEALAHVCERARHRFYPSWLEESWSFGPGGDGPGRPPQSHPWFFYRNIGVTFGVHWRKVIDFRGPPKWSAILGISTVLGPETQAVMWKDLHVIEVRGEDGKELRLAAAEDSAIPGFEPSSPSGAPGPMVIALELSEKAEVRLSRLRFSMVARVPQERRHYVIDDPLKQATAADEYFEVTVRDSESPDSWGYNAEIHIRPKKSPHADLAGVPVTVLYRFEPNSNAPSSGGFVFTGKGESTVGGTPWGSLRPATLPGGEKVRRLLGVEVIVPIGLQDRRIYVEFRDISLK